MFVGERLLALREDRTSSLGEVNKGKEAKLLGKFAARSAAWKNLTEDWHCSSHRKWRNESPFEPNQLWLGLQQTRITPSCVLRIVHS